MNNMKLVAGFILMIVTGISCNENKKQPLSLEGTWHLISATSTQKDSTVSTFNAKQQMIKIINRTHFAFLNHDLNNGKDTATAAYSAGGGTYTLADSIYTEHLDYFNDRQWENNKFEFVVKIVNDTLIQQGIEKVEKLDIDHIIVEKYKRITN
jgi:hypothetical protein